MVGRVIGAWDALDAFARGHFEDRASRIFRAMVFVKHPKGRAARASPAALGRPCRACRMSRPCRPYRPCRLHLPACRCCSSSSLPRPPSRPNHHQPQRCTRPLLQRRRAPGRAGSKAKSACRSATYASTFRIPHRETARGPSPHHPKPAATRGARRGPAGRRVSAARAFFTCEHRRPSAGGPTGSSRAKWSSRRSSRRRRR